MSSNEERRKKHEKKYEEERRAGKYKETGKDPYERGEANLRTPEQELAHSARQMAGGVKTAVGMLTKIPGALYEGYKQRKEEKKEK